MTTDHLNPNRALIRRVRIIETAALALLVLSLADLAATLGGAL